MGILYPLHVSPEYGRYTGYHDSGRSLGAPVRIRSKLQDWFSPEEAGAVGDGVTDDTAAFRLLANEVNNIKCSSGKIYRVGEVDLDGRYVDATANVGFRPMAGSRYMFKLKGYDPRFFGGFTQDQSNAIAFQTTTAGYAAGASTIVVASVAGMEVGMVVFVEDSANVWFHTVITGINTGTNTISLRNPAAGAGFAGARVAAMYGTFVIEDATKWMMCHHNIVNSYGAILMRTTVEKVPGKDDIIHVSNKGTMIDVAVDNFRYFGICKMNETAGVKINDVKLWGGTSETIHYVGNNTAGPYAVADGATYLKRNVTVKIGDSPKTLGVDFEYTDLSGAEIRFLSGRYPPIGSDIYVTKFCEGIRGFIEDQRNTSVIHGGNNYNQVEALGLRIGIHCLNAELTDFANCISDSCSKVSVQLESCVETLRFSELFAGFAPANIRAFSTQKSQFHGLYTNRVPPSEMVNPALLDDNVYLYDSKIEISLPEWSGPDYQMAFGGTSTPILSGGEAFRLESTDALPAGNTKYLRVRGPFQTTVAPGETVTSEGTFLWFVARCSTSPGAGQSFTYQLYSNGAALGSPIAISGDGNYEASAYLVLAASLGVEIVVGVTASGGANASIHRATLLKR
ncbi:MULTISPECIES: hypothetical protein [unclassified Beijerinckia]|uniref:hypothetical protein n=1 Tax=unclassified Beijerinckia TaxID=2638183 RepID=UPI000895A349|nr:MULTISPECIES: hypothetical protein [unclassified Beijerinckia]MDH7797502.1 hypothetical protein [Beijerinckia sp. GAS462]SEC88144.1 hypothetical protein SAMN05443249_3796 [Beijerinckia sp. 28-YEA-48]